MRSTILNKLLAAAPGVDYTVAPPGAERILQIVNIAGWIGVVAAVIGFIVAGIMMIMNATSSHGGNNTQMKGLGWTMAGSIVIGTASLWAATFAG